MNRNNRLGFSGAIILLFIGGLMTGLIYYLSYLPEKEAQETFIETSCIILDKEVLRERDSEGDLTYRPQFEVEYTVDGKTYNIWTYRISQASTSSHRDQVKILNRFDVGASYPCWYDPTYHGNAVLNKDISTFTYIFLYVGIGVLALGGLTLLFSIGKLLLALYFVATK